MHGISSLRTPLAAALMLAGALAACTASTDRILDIDAEGTVFIFLFRDDNLNGVFNAAVDQVMENVEVDLRLSRTLSIEAGGVTDTAGVRRFRVPVGRYRVEVDPAVLEDSLEVTVGSGEFTVVAGDSTVFPVALSFGILTITEARALALGRTAWVRGIVMNSPNVFGDSTVHIVDDSAAIRVTTVRPGLPVLPGDSALFLGRRTVRDGQPVITLVVVPVVQGVIPQPPPDSISTATAATAGGGSLDARYVKVAAATVSDTATVNNAFTLTVSDGSGDLTVVLSPNPNFGNPNLYAPGTVHDVMGLLVPDPVAAGRWVLKPRARFDITPVI